MRAQFLFSCLLLLVAVKCSLSNDPANYNDNKRVIVIEKGLNVISDLKNTEVTLKWSSSHFSASLSIYNSSITLNIEEQNFLYFNTVSINDSRVEHIVDEDLGLKPILAHNLTVINSALFNLSAKSEIFFANGTFLKDIHLVGDRVEVHSSVFVGERNDISGEHILVDEISSSLTSFSINILSRASTVFNDISVYSLTVTLTGTALNFSKIYCEIVLISLNSKNAMISVSDGDIYSLTLQSNVFQTMPISLVVFSSIKFTNVTLSSSNVERLELDRIVSMPNSFINLPGCYISNVFLTNTTFLHYLPTFTCFTNSILNLKVANVHIHDVLTAQTLAFETVTLTNSSVVNSHFLLATSKFAYIDGCLFDGVLFKSEVRVSILKDSIFRNTTSLSESLMNYEGGATLTNVTFHACYDAQLISFNGKMGVSIISDIFISNCSGKYVFSSMPSVYTMKFTSIFVSGCEFSNFCVGSFSNTRTISFNDISIVDTLFSSVVDIKSSGSDGAITFANISVENSQYKVFCTVMGSFSYFSLINSHLRVPDESIGFLFAQSCEMNVRISDILANISIAQYSSSKVQNTCCILTIAIVFF
ncbi:hypothetical protein PCE1_001767 [Barthelona sp. PCE]